MTHDEIGEAARQATYPSPYPSGWYHVFDVADVAPGQVKELRALGKDLVAFRGRDAGQIAVLDAHCPHQGASLASGGRVRGDCISCPFHHWSFSADGRLASIPGLTKIPRARMNAYPVREHYGMVWMYHDVSNALVQPPYEPERHSDIDAGRLRARGSYSPRDVDMHICEFIENSVDFQHFAVLHGDLTLPWTRIKIPGCGISHQARWEVDPQREHVAYFINDAHLTFAGKHYPRSGANARTTLFGPGGTVWFRFRLPKLGDVLLFQTHLPIAPLRQRVRFRWWADRKIPRPLVWYVVGHWISQWRADVEIWEKKIMRRKPVLVPIDGPVHEMRRWVKQFYEVERGAGAGNVKRERERERET